MNAQTYVDLKTKQKSLFMILRRYKDNVASIEFKDEKGESFGEAVGFETRKDAKTYLREVYIPNEVDAWLFEFAIVPVPKSFIKHTNIKIYGR